MQKDREKSYRELVSRHRDLIWHVCSDYSLSAAWEMEDAIQEVLCALWNDYARHNVRNEKAWVYHVATSTMIDLKRKAHNKPQMSEDNIPERPNESDENYLHLLQLIDNLDAESQRIIRAHLDNFRNYEIARMTGLSLATIGRRLKEIKQTLREQYNKDTEL